MPISPTIISQNRSNTEWKGRTLPLLIVILLTFAWLPSAWAQTQDSQEVSNGTTNSTSTTTKTHEYTRTTKIITIDKDGHSTTETSDFTTTDQQSSALPAKDSPLLTIIQSTQSLAGVPLCDNFDLKDGGQRTECAKKQMEWACKNGSSTDELAREFSKHVMSAYFKFCYKACGQESCSNQSARDECLNVCCPYRDQMISIGHINPFFDCANNRYSTTPADYNPCTKSLTK